MNFSSDGNSDGGQRPSDPGQSPGANESLADLGTALDPTYRPAAGATERDSKPADEGVINKSLLASYGGRRISSAHIDLSALRATPSLITPKTAKAIPQPPALGGPSTVAPETAQAIAQSPAQGYPSTVAAETGQAIPQPSVQDDPPTIAHAIAQSPVQVPVVMQPARGPSAVHFASMFIASIGFALAIVGIRDSAKQRNTRPAMASAAPVTATLAPAPTVAIAANLAPQEVRANVPSAGNPSAVAAVATSPAPVEEPATPSSESAQPEVVAAHHGARVHGGARGVEDHEPVPAPPAAAPATQAVNDPPMPIAPAPAAPVSCRARCGDDIDCMARCAVGGRAVAPTPSGSAVPAAPVAAANAEPALPESPSRVDVARTLAAVTGAVRECAGGQGATAYISVTFASSGRVTIANTEMPYGGTPAGSCMSRALRSASVPPFARSTFSVRAPFSMQ